MDDGAAAADGNDDDPDSCADDGDADDKAPEAVKTHSLVPASAILVIILVGGRHNRHSRVHESEREQLSSSFPRYVSSSSSLLRLKPPTPEPFSPEPVDPEPFMELPVFHKSLIEPCRS